VTFRGAVYHFPVSIWLPYAYPREAPLVYVTPTYGMKVRPGQHVDVEGRVYHPYLARWNNFWDVSLRSPGRKKKKGMMRGTWTLMTDDRRLRRGAEAKWKNAHGLIEKWGIFLTKRTEIECR
jgi:hypothetical protein